MIGDFGLWTLEELFRGNGVTLRTQKVIQGGDNGRATSGVLARFPLLLPVRNSFASYGASAAVARTSDRGHVAEVEKPDLVTDDCLGVLGTWCVNLPLTFAYVPFSGRRPRLGHRGDLEKPPKDSFC
jgi:hypothetical protein